MLTYTLEKTRSEPLYSYLSRRIRDDILAGNIRSGERLPSKRPFAKNLGISVITVENAYARLLDEGYIISLPKRGYYASDLKALAALRNNNLPKPEMGKKPAEKRLLADLTSSQNELSGFPFSVWSGIMRRELRCDQQALLTNPPTGGVPELREAIADHLRAFHGMEVHPSQIVVGPGTEYLIALLVRLLGRNLVYAMEDPGYPRTGQVYRSLGVPTACAALDSSGVTVESLENTGASVAHVSPSHNFPTGVVMPPSRRYELLGWAAKRSDRYIIEDDYDSEFRLSGKPLSTLKSVDALGRVIYMNTFTKTLASTVRISYMVLPPELSVRFTRENSYLSCAVSNFEQYTLARFMELGSFETHLNRMRRLCLRKRDAFMALIAKGPLGKHASVSGQNAGLHFLLTLRTSENDETIAERALSLGVRIAPLSRFFHDKKRALPHVFVISYSSVPLDALAGTVRALEQAMCPGDRPEK